MIPSYDQQIARLQRDKIIYAVESIATTLVMLFIALTLISTNLFTWDHVLPATIVCVLIATGYWLYMGIGNALRLKHIIELQKEEKTK
jgi:uncharacterized integral membrane protein